jgi:hypothetical protein
LPDFAPDETYAGHVEVSNFNQALQTELAWVVAVQKLSFANLAEIFNEENDSVLIQVDTALEDAVDLGHRDVLDD